MTIETVTGMGVLIVFIGLICLIALVYIMGKIVGGVAGKQSVATEKAASAPQTAAHAASAASAPVSAIANRDELIVAFSAAVAEELGTDVSAIRVVSFKEL